MVAAANVRESGTPVRNPGQYYEVFGECYEEFGGYYEEFGETFGASVDKGDLCPFLAPTMRFPGNDGRFSRQAKSISGRYATAREAGQRHIPRCR